MWIKINKMDRKGFCAYVLIWLLFSFKSKSTKRKQKCSIYSEKIERNEKRHNATLNVENKNKIFLTEPRLIVFDFDFLILDNKSIWFSHYQGSKFEPDKCPFPLYWVGIWWKKEEERNATIILCYIENIIKQKHKVKKK